MADSADLKKLFELSATVVEKLDKQRALIDKLQKDNEKLRSALRTSTSLNPQITPGTGNRPTKIALLTAGGLAPCLSSAVGGLIRRYNELHPDAKILCYRGGYKGLLLGDSFVVSHEGKKMAGTLHLHGGSPIGNSRVKLTNVKDCLKRGLVKEGQDPQKVAADQLVKDGVQVLHTIGGDDTNIAAADLADFLAKNDYRLTVIGLPKTIDNDVFPIKQTLGAYTAAEQGAKFFGNVVNEQSANPRMLIIHEVMGRSCGWLTVATAKTYRDSLRSKPMAPSMGVHREKLDVHAVFIPEVPIDIAQEAERLKKVMDDIGSVNIFLSEGAGVDDIVKEMESRGEELPRDAFGHVKLDAVNPGEWFASRFAELLKAEKTMVQKSGYFSRSAPANTSDIALIKSCCDLAVDCAFHGISGVIGHDEDYEGILRACEFDRIKGGKPFDTSQAWFREMMAEIRHPVRLERPPFVPFELQDLVLSVPPSLTIPKKVAFLTAGGLAPCLSSALGGLIERYCELYPSVQMMCYRSGYKGVLLGDSFPLGECARQDCGTLHLHGGSAIDNSRVKLTNVKDCVARGLVKEGEDPQKVAADQLVKDGVNVLHTIGGDDTNTAAADLAKYLEQNGYKLIVIGLPKTIDNDVIPIKQTLGAYTAAEQGAQYFANVVYESTANPRMLIVHEIMGRACGWLTASTAHFYRGILSTRGFCADLGLNKSRFDVHAVFVPEVPIDIDSEAVRLKAVMDKNDCVNIFLSEGAGVDDIVRMKEAKGEKLPRDAFGHVKLDAVKPGEFFAKQFAAAIGAEKVLVQKSGYFGRSAPANTEDLRLIKSCTDYAVQSAVQGEPGVIGHDEEQCGVLRAIEFDRIKGGKPFDTSQNWFAKMLMEIGQKAKYEKQEGSAEAFAISSEQGQENVRVRMNMNVKKRSSVLFH